MRRFASSVALFVMAAAVTASAAQTRATSFCDRIAALIRSAPQDPWVALTKGKSPFIELMGDSEMKSLGFADYRDDADLVNRFVAKFNPGPILILYTLQDGKLEPAGSAIVEKGRGTLKSVKTSARR